MKLKKGGDMMRIIRRNNLIDDLFYDFFRSNNDLAKTDLYEDEQNIYIDIDVPGFKKEDIKIELNNGYLSIQAATAEEKDNNEESNFKYRIKERRSVEFTRRYKLDDAITEKDIKVKLEDGVLKVLIKKLEKVLPTTKTISIE